MLLALGLGACSATNEAEIAKGAGISAPPKTEYTIQDFTKKSAYCPPIQIRAGTATMTVYERGHQDESAYVRYLASITQTARECSLVGNTLTVKVGVAGRVIAGPKGSAANITIPIRVAVAKQFGGTGPFYSQLFKVPISLAAPAFGANYNQVFDQVVATVGPEDRDLIIYVGFDEGPKS